MGLGFCRCFLCRRLGSSIFCSLCSFSLGFCSGSGSLLVCNLLGNRLIDLLLCLKVLCSYCLLAVSFFLLYSFNSCDLCLFPGIELLLACSLIKCAFPDTATKMLHHVDTFTLEDVACRVCRLSTGLDPVKCTIKIQIYCGWIGIRVISTNLLSKLTITW